jgi:hypothetical protein
VILKDLGLTSHILKAANAPLCNRSGRSIGSVAHGITMLGWDTVRNVVSALRYAEHYAAKSPGLRELMVLSILSATHGRQVAMAVGYPRPEEAYVCGLFRNLGEVLLARYYGLEYAAMLDIMERERICERAASVRVFDVAADDVGSKLAEAWNLPPAVRTCLQSTPAVAADDRCLSSIVNYGHELTTALYRKGAQFESIHLKTVLDPSGRQVLISQRDLRRIVDTGVEDTSHTLAALRVGVPELHLARQAEQARELLEAAIEGTPLHFDAAAMDHGIGEMEEAVIAENLEVTQLVRQGLELLTGECGFERALFALMNEDRTAVRGRLGSGDDAAVDAFDFRVYAGDTALDAAVSRRQDLWIKRRVDSRYDASGVVIAYDPSHFALFPLVVGGVVAGVLYADRRKLQAPDEMRARVNRLRDVLARAIERAAGPRSSSG